MKNMFLEITEARHLERFVVEVTFNNQEQKIVDFEPYLKTENRKILQPLKNSEFFKSVFAHKEFGTLSWDGEIDIAPEFVYSLGH